MYLIVITKRVLILATFIASISSVFAQEAKDSVSPENPFTPKSASTKTISVQKESDNRVLFDTKSLSFSINFDNWNPDHRHWNPPSNMLIYSDGSWFMYAKKISNQRRECQIIDCGSSYTFLANITYYSGYDAATNTCTGNIVHSEDYALGTLRYKEERFDATANGVDAKFANVNSQAICASTTQWIR